MTSVSPPAPPRTGGVMAGMGVDRFTAGAGDESFVVERPLRPVAPEPPSTAFTPG
ncbi:hypothetical protein ACFU5O_19270 [Streptomyces sp. NPDC057445]|uniref:hypothetical protein n=1 Tax=Streptomyces sp. NPDC057445 TaxID=3346136 RepID=UPI003683503D